MKLTDKLFGLFENGTELKEKDVGEFKSFSISGMKFTPKCYYADGIGHVCTMNCVGMLGLMKMDTFVISPFERDMPLFSIDFISAFGKLTMLLELYDTTVELTVPTSLDAVNEKYAALRSYDPGEHWYDHLKLSQSAYKRGKAKQTADFEEYAIEYLSVYLKTLLSAPTCDIDAKKKRAAVYTDGMIENGGPAVNFIAKKYGKEKTAVFLRTVMFGV